MSFEHIRYTLAGFYCPSFFNIRVNACNDIYETSLAGNSVLFHEYVHFLQDITTTAGYGRLYNLLSKIEYMCRELQGKKEVSIPYSVESDEWKISEDLERRIDCYDRYNWDDYKIIDIKCCLQEGVVLKIQTNDSLQEIPFGAYQIDEIMAECCESNHPLYVACNHYPYNLWEKFNDFFSCNLSKNDYARLSYVSLNSIFPGKQFYNILDGLACNDLDYMLKHSFEVNNASKVYLRDKSLEMMSWLYGNEFPGVLKWYERCVNSNKIYDDYDAFVQLLDNMLDPNSSFGVFVENNGLPIASDAKGNYGLGLNVDNDLYGIIALQHCVDVLCDAVRGACPLRFMCKELEKEEKCERITYDCLGTPWNYQKDGQLCFMSKMWKSLGFPSEVKLAEA